MEHPLYTIASIIAPIILSGEEFLDLLGEGGYYFLPVADDAIAGFLEDIGFGVSVYRHDVFGAGATSQMLTGT